MARQASNREDLMREASALRERAEFRVPGAVTTVVAGYRTDGSLSVYFGADPCFHFDPQLRLRRAFIGGHLYRTQGTTLARLTRIREGSAVVLRRHDLTEEELDVLIHSINEQMSQLCDAFDRGVECLESVPSNTDVDSRLSTSLRSLTAAPLKLSPAIRGKP